MSLHIPQDHPLFSLKDAVENATQAFLKSMGFNYFQYLRCFDNGAVSLLTTHPQIFDFFNQEAKKNKPLVFSTLDQANAHSFWFLWDEALCLKEGKVIVPGRHGMSHITAQELNCLR